VGFSQESIQRKAMWKNGEKIYRPTPNGMIGYHAADNIARPTVLGSGVVATSRS
jgi:hypothetical protein